MDPILVCGIDPGISGAVCILEGKEAQIKTLIKMPVLTAGTKNTLDLIELSRILANLTYCGIEAVHAFPGQGVTSMFNFGKGFGSILGILAALRVPYREIAPQTWKSAFLRDMPKEKESAVIRAQQLCPDINLLATDRSKKKDIGLADAYLIARYAHRDYMNQQEDATF